jgi:hypothetical protein
MEEEEEWSGEIAKRSQAELYCRPLLSHVIIQTDGGWSGQAGRSG